MNEKIAFLTLAVMSATTAVVLIDWVRIVAVATRRRANRLCAFCGYSRRGIRSRVCPECGRPVEPSR